MADDTKPLRISWSALQRHEACAHRNWLVMQGKSNKARDIRIFLPGNVVDRAMKAWLDGNGEGSLPALADAHLEKFLTEEKGDGVVRWRGRKDRLDVVRFCSELLTRLEPVLIERVLPYDYQTALRFTAPIQMPYLDGRPTVVHLTGEMDLLVKTPYGLWDWDLKATADKYYWKKALGQLVFYDLAATALYDVIPAGAGFLQPMAEPQILEFTFAEADRSAMWSRIARMASDIWARDTLCTTNTANCSRCDVKHACVRFKPARSGPALGPLFENV